MKVAKLYRFNDIRIEEMPVPSVGPRDALIRTKACGICSGDVMPWYIEKKAPLVIGHEPAGEVVALGREAETSLRPGDRVFVHHHAPCLHCRFCARGDYVQCATWRKTRIEPGGISEYILVPEVNLLNDTLRLPDTLGYEEGTLVEPAACVVKSLRRSSLRRGDTVLLIGLGVMGQMHVLLAREFGARTVIGADRVPFRLNKALELGADHVVDVSQESLADRVRELTGGSMAEIVIVGPNSVAAMEQGIQTAAPGGTVVFFTPARPGELLTVDPNDLYFRDITLVTSYSCGPDDTRHALDFMERGIISAEKIVTHRFSLSGAGEAYRLTAEAKESLKCLIVFDGV
ncbi:MAG: alcohol dehydrogenase catalytic domain-containing protein [Thermodesulfovibrionales bacterium]